VDLLLVFSSTALHRPVKPGLCAWEDNMSWFWIAKNGGKYLLELLGCSYNCPGLKLYGYATERQLQNAINRKTKPKEV
jgi:hypothetical protein